MTVSIIIAVKNWQDNLDACIKHCQNLDFADFEILVLPDDNSCEAKIASSKAPFKVIPTGAVNPAAKRDIALAQAQGEILAFIDDDAYPAQNWLSEAVKNFSDPDVAAVGGPAVTPASDKLMQKASGLVYASPMVSAKFVYRYVPGQRKNVDDYPSCNFLARKSIMQQLGGFNTKFWPGEDTKLCRDITKKLAKKIVYDPGVLVYHHRRSLFCGHLKQVASYALHRGFFVKAFPETSRRPTYFVPSLFLLCLVLGAAFSFIAAAFRAFYFTGVLIYLVSVFIFSLAAGVRFVIPVFFGIISTHLAYGAFFLKGLFARRLGDQ